MAIAYRQRYKGRKNPNWRGGIWSATEAVHLRQARLKANGGHHTDAQWRELKERFGNTCLWCYRSEPEIKLTQDHIVSVKDGGSDDIENIQPLCQECNTRKRMTSAKFLVDPKESEIQKSILDYLRLKGILSWKNNNVGIYKKETGQYIPSHHKGISDIFAIKDGVFYSIEVKRPSGKTTPDQVQFLQQVVANGGIGIVARSVEDVMAHFERQSPRKLEPGQVVRFPAA
jgi:hypothetical protein